MSEFFVPCVRRRDLILGGAAFVALSSLGSLAWAQAGRRLSFTRPAVQGGLVLARAEAATQAWVNDTAVRVENDLFCFGFGRDEEKPANVRVTFADGTTETASIAPAKREFPTQRINGLPEQYVTPPPEVAERIARDARVVGETRAINTDATWYAETLDWPTDGRISGVYGAQRILNGQPREPHYGIDIASPAGTPIKAPADGIVRMAEELYLSGNTLILDHGHGVSTSYLHMSRFDTKPGDQVKRGAVLGLVGATGRATGPHLCWRMNWFQTRLDAALSASPRPDRT
jgi:murein DD-endopeptidase MepM/ murein hydrolase activator NlpD